MINGEAVTEIRKIVEAVIDGKSPDWMTLAPIIISIVAVVFSLTSIIITCKNSKISTETTVMGLYFSEREKYIAVSGWYRDLSEEDKEKKLLKKKIKIAHESYNNVLDYMCTKYLSNELSKKTFEETMKIVIITRVMRNASLKYGLDINKAGYWENLKEVSRIFEKKFPEIVEAENEKAEE